MIAPFINNLERILYLNTMRRGDIYLVLPSPLATQDRMLLDKKLSTTSLNFELCYLVLSRLFVTHIEWHPYVDLLTLTFEPSSSGYTVLHNIIEDTDHPFIELCAAFRASSWNNEDKMLSPAPRADCETVIGRASFRG